MHRNKSVELLVKTMEYITHFSINPRLVQQFEPKGLKDWHLGHSGCGCDIFCERKIWPLFICDLVGLALTRLGLDVVARGWGLTFGTPGADAFLLIWLAAVRL